MKKKLSLTILIVILIAGAAIAAWQNSQPAIPKAISKQIDFPAYYSKNLPDGYTLDKRSIKVHTEGRDKLFTYIIEKDGNRINFNQQAYPEVLIFEKLTNSMQPYDEIETAIGKVTLARPSNLKGKQAAVVNPPGLLMFAEPESDLSSADWRTLFNSMERIK